MEVKKGQEYYDSWINVESEIGRKSTVEFRTWIVTSVTKDAIHVREKSELTWGKISKKNNDYGWKPVDAWIRTYCCKKYPDYETLRKSLHCSKSAAYRSVLMEARKYKKDATRILTQIEKAIQKNKPIK